MMKNLLLDQLSVEAPFCSRAAGVVVGVRGPLIHARVPAAGLTHSCLIRTRCGREITAQVVAFSDDVMHLAALDDLTGVGPGDIVETSGTPVCIKVGDWLRGCVVDALGKPFEGACRQHPAHARSLHCRPPHATKRSLISQQLITGITAIDALTSLGLGQRVGILAPAGVGKSTLLAAIARNAQVDIIVIALVGERGREVRQFIEQTLGPAGLERSCIVVATSDESALRRSAAAFTATTIAEYFRDRGQNVLLLVDSLTRAARAMRDVGLASGELPVRQGYTPSVYSELPKLLERAGTGEKGTISALYTLLIEDEAQSDPLAEEVKSILDGHIVMSRRQAEDGIRPAIDIRVSLSRLMHDLVDREHNTAAEEVRRALARLQRDRDILLLGGTPDAELKRLLELQPTIRAVLGQGSQELRSLDQSRSMLIELADKLGQSEKSATIER